MNEDIDERIAEPRPALKLQLPKRERCMPDDIQDTGVPVPALSHLPCDGPRKEGIVFNHLLVQDPT